MADNKQLTFSFVLDEQSFQRVKRALGELQTEAQKLAKSLQGAQGGLFSGANVGGRTPSAVQSQGRMPGTPTAGAKVTGVGSAILGDIESFKKLASDGSKSMDIMKNAIGRSLQEQGQYVAKLDKQIALLQERFGGLKTEAQRANAAIAMMMLSTERGQAVDQLQNLIETNMALTNRGGAPGMPSPTPSGGGGFFSSLGSVLTKDLTGGAGQAIASGNMSQILGAALGPSLGAIIARSVGIAVAGSGQVLKTSANADRMELNLESARGRATAGIYSRFRGGDLSDLDAMSAVDRKGMEMAFRSVFGDDRGAQKYMSAVASLPSDLTGSAFTSAAMGTLSAEEYDQVLNDLKARGEYRYGIGRARGYTEETRGERLTSSRILGRGFYKDKTGRWTDNFSEWRAGLHEKGFTTGEAAQAYLESAQGAGTGKYSGLVMGATAAGWGNYGQLALAGARRGNVEYAKMAIGGGINRAAGIQLGQLAIGSGFDPRGTVSPEAVIGAFQGGYGDMLGPKARQEAQFNAVQQYAAGLGVGNTITSGRLSGFQTGMNVLNAISNFGGGGTYAQDYLATGMTYEQMLAGAGGKLTKTAEMTGITPEMIRQQISGNAESALALWVDQGKRDPASEAMRRYQKSGKTLDEFAKTASIRDIEGIGVTLGLMNPELGEEGAIGYMRSLRGIGTKAKTGTAPWGGVDTESAGKRKVEADAMRADAAALSTAFPTLEQNTQDSTRYQEIIMQNTTNISSTLMGLATWLMERAGATPETIQRTFGSNTAQAVTAGKTYSLGLGFGAGLFGPKSPTPTAGQAAAAQPPDFNVQGPTVRLPKPTRQ